VVYASKTKGEPVQDHRFANANRAAEERESGERETFLRRSFAKATLFVYFCIVGRENGC